MKRPIVHNLFRIVTRRNHRGPEPRPRASSLPFVSGDTFRSLAEVIIEDGEVRSRSSFRTGVIFAQASDSVREDFLLQLKEAVGQLSGREPRSLVIHNGDIVPRVEKFDEIRLLVSRVFSLNVLDDSVGVTPIPIGLENVALKHNGKLHYYLDEMDQPTHHSLRNNLVLSSFHVSTNQSIRGPLRELMKESRFGHRESFLKSLDYRLAVRRSKFVISPPGNGIDCHRTWEAVYLGAVPVILRGYLAPSLVKNQPILEVQDYEEFLSYSDDDLEQIFISKRQLQPSKAWAHSWIPEILGQDK